MKMTKGKPTAKSQKGLLVSVARTIGTTLGTLAAKTASVSATSTKPATGPARIRKTPVRTASTARRRRKA